MTRYPRPGMPRTAICGTQTSLCLTGLEIRFALGRPQPHREVRGSTHCCGQGQLAARPGPGFTTVVRYRRKSSQEKGLPTASASPFHILFMKPKIPNCFWTEAYHTPARVFMLSLPPLLYVSPRVRSINAQGPPPSSKRLEGSCSGHRGGIRRITYRSAPARDRFARSAPDRALSI